MKRTMLLLLALVAGGAWLIAGADRGLRHEHVTSAGRPLDVVHPSVSGRRPGVVVAHGFSGSARLMAPFGDTLAARGYVVVLVDFAGHGANTSPLPDQTAGTERSTDALADDLATAVAHLRSRPDVDPSRIALVGHSMGAGAVTRYAAAHPDVTATVAISLPSAVAASAERPARLLTVVGALEFPGFRSAATTVAAQRDDRAVRVVPGVEHISVLYAPATHRATVDWLDQAFDAPRAEDGTTPPSPRADDGTTLSDRRADDGIPFPGRRLAGAALLGLALLLGLHPLAARLGERRATPRRPAPRLMIAAIATGAAVVGALTARLLPTTILPLAIGGYVAAYAAVTGALLLLYATRRTREHLKHEDRTVEQAGAHHPPRSSGPAAATAGDRRPAQSADRSPGPSDDRQPAQTAGLSLGPSDDHRPAQTGDHSPGPSDDHRPAHHGGPAAAGSGGHLPATKGGPGSEGSSDGASAKTGLRLRYLLVPAYAAIAIAVPVHLGMTHALPVGDRWWLLSIIWAAFALLAYATERVTDGDPVAVLAIAAVFVAVLAVAAMSGLTHGFVVLVLFPLIGLLLWQALWSALLHRFAAPTWAIALAGSLVVTWPLAVTLPLVG
ncbi:dienelactone hydrolase family protein [Actinoplanes sp. CA-252034]|uniref:dienelactone hydrolase family protein n=1 Tax=Actinoplanes sp. CA-252034 TaxID=3239906 RepID=UPI003D9749B9